jgi:hypothetical protein
MTEVKSYLEALMTLDEAPLKLDPGQVIFSAGTRAARCSSCARAPSS